MSERRVVRRCAAAEEGLVVGVRVHADQRGERSHDERLWTGFLGGESWTMRTINKAPAVKR